MGEQPVRTLATFSAAGLKYDTAKATTTEHVGAVPPTWSSTQVLHGDPQTTLRLSEDRGGGSQREGSLFPEVET